MDRRVSRVGAGGVVCCGLVAIRGLAYRVTRARNGFAGRRRLQCCQAVPLSFRGGGPGRSVRCWCQCPAGSAPVCPLRGAPTVLSSRPSFRGGAGRSVCSRRCWSVTRARCGPGGLHSGWNARTRVYYNIRSPPIYILLILMGGELKFCCYPGSLPKTLGGRGPCLGSETLELVVVVVCVDALL